MSKTEKSVGIFPSLFILNKLTKICADVLQTNQNGNVIGPKCLLIPEYLSLLIMNHKLLQD